MTDFCLGEGSPLPSGWSYATAGDFRRKHAATFNPVVASDEKYELWSVPSHACGAPEVVAAENIGSNKQCVAPGDVLISRINPRLNRTWVVGHRRDFVQIASTEWVVFPKSGGMDSRYFARLLSDFRIRDFLASNASGVGGSLTRARPALFEKLKIPIPPLNEQRRIVERIETLFEEIDRGVDSLRTAKNSIALYRQSLLKSAFEGRLTADWRAQNPDKTESPDTLLSRIREEREARYEAALHEWERAVAKWRKGGAKGKKSAKPIRPRPLSELAHSNQSKSSWPSVELGDLVSVKSGLGLTSKQMRGGPYSVYGGNGITGCHDQYFLQAAVLIIGRVGAKCGVTHITEPKSWVTDNALIVTPLVDSFDKRFFKRLLEIKNLNSLGSSTGQPVISGSKIYPVLLDIPPLAEQAEIVRLLDTRLEAAAMLDREIDANLARADVLRQSILKKAFAGQLVPQNPDDEPASALLERIQARRAETPARRWRARVEA